MISFRGEPGVDLVVPVVRGFGVAGRVGCDEFRPGSHKVDKVACH